MGNGDREEEMIHGAQARRFRMFFLDAPSKTSSIDRDGGYSTGRLCDRKRGNGPGGERAVQHVVSHRGR